MGMTWFQISVSTCNSNCHTLGYCMPTWWADQALLSRVNIKEWQPDHFLCRVNKLRKAFHKLSDVCCRAVAIHDFSVLACSVLLW